jgi:hypothetical protein
MDAKINRVQNNTSKMYQRVRQIQKPDKSYNTAQHQTVGQTKAYKFLPDNLVHKGLVQLCHFSIVPDLPYTAHASNL